MPKPENNMRLYSRQSNRLYLNSCERKQFAECVNKQNLKTKLLCLTLFYTGCRVSEALNLRFCDLHAETGLIAVASLKKRHKHHVREIPVPKEFIDELYETFKGQSSQFKLWSLHRSNAWRQVCKVMTQAGITGSQATPKGLRHSFGVHCAFSNVAMPLCQKWMGHSDIKKLPFTTKL